jgi:copper chaperone NosL
MNKIILSTLIAVLSIFPLAGFSSNGSLGLVKNLTNDTRCNACGMIILNYPGPHAELVITKPDGRVEYKYYGNIVESMKYIITELKHKQNTVMVYVQPMDHHAFNKMYLKGNWVLAKNAYFVVNSKKYFIMGPGYYPFKHKKNAEKFIKRHHGRIMSFDRIVSILSTRIDT